jgi:hypothetical protein
VLSRAGAAFATMVATAGVARADGDLGLVSPRAIGHAGAALVSDDGPAALFACPAAMARRDARRAQLAGLVVDDDVWLAGADHPRISDRGPAELVPVVGGVGALGPVIIGVGFATTASLDRRLPEPEPGLPAATVIADFPHRYGALDARWTRRSLALGVAARPTEWLAVGASGVLSRVDARERRRVWAGFGRDMPLGYPMRDVIVEIDASDALVPGAALGALVAPTDVPLELALGASWTASVDAAGDASLAVANTPADTTVDIQAPTVEAAGARASGTFASPLVLHAGVRWVGARYAVEGGATAWSYRGAGAAAGDAWTITGARVVDETGASAPVERFATRIGRRSHAAVRASVDVEIIPGFAWVSAGYGWRGAGQARNATTLGGVDRGGHTLALGAELTAGDVVITLGWSRQLARDTTVGAPGLPWDNPIAPEALPANLGTYGQSRDVVGIGVEIASP